MSVLILSGHTEPSLRTPANHAYYAKQHGYRYVFDSDSYHLGTPYDHKLRAIEAALGSAREDFILWIDEDAFFSQVEMPVEALVGADIAAPWQTTHASQNAGSPLVERREILHIARSPVNPKGGWSIVNAGVMLIRVGEEALRLVRAALETPEAQVLEWWRPDDHGTVYVSGGDQERLVYCISESGFADACALHEHTLFNSRSYDVTGSLNEHYVIHLANFRDKADGSAQVQQMFALDPDFLPEAAGESGGRLRRRIGRLLRTPR